MLNDVTVETQTGVGGVGLQVDNNARVFGSQIFVYQNDIGINALSGGVLQLSNISVDSAFTAGINISGSVDDRIVGGLIGNVKGNASGSGHDNQ